MQIKLEFAEKLVDIKPSIQLLTLGVEGEGRQRRGRRGGDINDSIIYSCYYYYTELLECSSLRDICYVALIAGNIINGVSSKPQTTT